MAESSAASFGQPIPGYEVLAQIGSGGSSTVYRARQLSLGREVALKVVRGDREERTTKLARMEKEAQVLARLDHENIVRSIDFGEAGDLVYFVMEYVPGVSARQLLERRGRLPVGEALFLAEKVAAAVGEAARVGVIHRDIKPDNILLSKGGGVKLSDFGLARAVFDRSLTRDGATLGTPQYMSPEQIRHPRGVDLRSDLYSLGATLYHLVTGQAPFHGESVAEILHEVLYGRPVPPEQIVDDLPRALSRVIARLMARNPARRYQDVPSLIRDLQRVRRLGDPDAEADTDPIGLSWQAAAEGPSVWARRGPLLVGGLAVLLLGAALAFVFAGPRRDTEVVDPLASEVAALEDLRGQLDDTPFRVLRVLDELARGGSSTGRVEVLRAALEQDARDRARARIREAARAAVEQARERVREGELVVAPRVLEEGFVRALESEGEAVEASPDELCGFDVRARRDEALGPEREALRGLREKLSDAYASVHSGVREEAVAFLRGTAGAAGPLETAHFDAARTGLDALQASLPEREVPALFAVFREAGIALDPGVDAERLREAVAPDLLDSEQDATQALFEQLRMDCDLAERNEQQRLFAAVQERRAALDGLRADDPRVAESVSEWMDRLRRDLPGVDREDLGSPEPVDWRSALAAYEEELGRVLIARREERADQRMQGLLLGQGEEAGVLELLEDRRPALALAALEAPTGVGEPRLLPWRELCRGLVQIVDDTWRRLERAEGQELELFNGAGILVRGELRLRGRDDAFRVGRQSLRLEDLPLEFLWDSTGVEQTPAQRALTLSLWGSKKEREAIDALLPGLDANDPLVAIARERREAERMLSEGMREELESEAEGLWTSMEGRVREERYAEARGLLEQFRRLRFRKTEAYLARRSRIGEFEAAIRAGESLEAASRTLRPRYAHAGRFDLRADGRLDLLYDFESAAQAEDFALTGGVSVANRALRFLNSYQAGATLRGDRGPSLPLAIDRSRPFDLQVDFSIPLEEEEPPKFVGVLAAGLCVGIYQPTVRRESVPPQLAVWEGRLEDRGRHLFDPSLGETEPASGVLPRAVGVRAGSRHTLVLRWDPDRVPALEVLLDGELVAERAAHEADDEVSPRFELRVCAPDVAARRGEGTERFVLHAVRFQGVLRP